MISSDYKILSSVSSKRRFGSIYKGEHIASGKKVVIKVAEKSGRQSLAAERLKWEAQFTFNLKGLPQVLSIFEDESAVILVSEWKEGMPLDQFWKTIKKKDQYAFLVEFMSSFKTILNYLHGHGIYHLDLKPGNILVQRTENDDLNIDLIDFGLAWKKDHEEHRSVLFPLGFAAPEVVLNQLDLVDHRSDFFSLGILTWNLFTGKLPLSHPNPSIFTNLQLTHPLPEHHAVNKSIYRVLLKMTHKTSFKVPPNQMPLSEMRNALLEGMSGRYSNFEEIILDLESAKPSKNWFYQRISFLKPRLNPKVKG